MPGSGRSPGGGHGNPLQPSCLENPHGHRSLAGYSPWGHKESDTTERLTHTHTLVWAKTEVRGNSVTWSRSHSCSVAESGTGPSASKSRSSGLLSHPAAPCFSPPEPSWKMKIQSSATEDASHTQVLVGSPDVICLCLHCCLSPVVRDNRDYY